MSTPTITSRVADLVRNPNSSMPNEWERSAQKTSVESAQQTPAKQDFSKSTQNTQDIKLASGDALTLSPLAQKILEESDSYGQSEWEKSRSENVQRVQQLVQDRQYSLSPETIDEIAKKIVDMLP